METIIVCIGTPENVLQFVKLTDRLEATMYFKSDSAIINAKSLLGILSSEFDQPKRLEISGSPEMIRKAKQAIRFFILPDNY